MDLLKSIPTLSALGSVTGTMESAIRSHPIHVVVT